MLEANRQRIVAQLDDDDIVLDVGGWAKPLHRADWVIDLLPYETRGLYGDPDPDPQRFSERTWIQRDICDRQPFPFADDSIDFVVCSHTLEDIRDPIWVCSELSRIARAGYIEVPSRLQEQSWGIHGRFVGWSHHRWLIEIDPPAVEFVGKPALLHGDRRFSLPSAPLTAEQAVQFMFWRGEIEAGERIFIGPGEIDAYLADFVNGQESRGLGTTGSRGRRLVSRVLNRITR